MIASIPPFLLNLKRMDEYEKMYVSMIRKYHNHTLQTNPRHREDKLHKIHKTPGEQLSKATSSLFPIKMITQLKSIHRNVKLIMEQTQNPTIGATINNNRTTALERPTPSLLCVWKSNILRTSDAFDNNSRLKKIVYKHV